MSTSTPFNVDALTQCMDQLPNHLPVWLELKEGTKMSRWAAYEMLLLSANFLTAKPTNETQQFVYEAIKPGLKISSKVHTMLSSGLNLDSQNLSSAEQSLVGQVSTSVSKSVEYRFLLIVTQKPAVFVNDEQ
eukprot:TRINITY_DN3214_c0_g1_i1.p1 TRINITY_DN3214_c0_g1~~TRINITY_DN3214_c0_g1_i1.p1  ORF type:complete len:139 (-),score=28.24 TRINITY_DN3214_c0_g1_i1:164-559(-)